MGVGRLVVINKITMTIFVYDDDIYSLFIYMNFSVKVQSQSLLIIMGIGGVGKISIEPRSSKTHPNNVDIFSDNRDCH